jgi:hypothetical protein
MWKNNDDTIWYLLQAVVIFMLCRSCCISTFETIVFHFHFFEIQSYAQFYRFAQQICSKSLGVSPFSFIMKKYSRWKLSNVSTFK